MIRKISPVLALLAIVMIAEYFHVDLHNVIQEVIMNDGSHEQQGESVLVTRIIDGDTCEIEMGERVRLIGIDTPERGEIFYKEASEHLAQLILGKNVTMIRDVSEKDRYGRLLRHIYYGDQWVNKIMIEEGYARLATYPPDVAHVQEFQKAERQAREDKRGIWSIDDVNYEEK